MVLGEGELDRLMKRPLGTHLCSRQLCCVYVCPSNIGHATGGSECAHWVCFLISFVTLTDYFVRFSAVLASFLLNEELGHLGRLGCTLCLIGSLIIVLHAPEDKPVETVDEILHYALQPGMLCLRRHVCTCDPAIVFDI